MSPPATAPPRPETREAIVRFLRAVFTGGHGLIECRALPSKARCFAALDAIEPLIQFLADHRHEETYVGIALRRTDANGTRENCGELLAVFVDINFKQTSEPEARARLAAFPIPPGLVVASGGGLHVYWRLTTPLDVQTDAERAGAVLRRLALALGADASAAEPARVLRPAGTWNRKYDPPRRVTIEAYERERCVALADLEAALPDEPAAAAPGTPFQLPDVITPGARRTTLFRCARALRWRGLTAEAITAALLIENTRRCQPPLEAAQVREQVANAFARADRPDFVAASDGARSRAESEAPSGATVQDPAPPPAAPETWPELAPEAFYGPVGRLVETIAPHTEGDPAALLGQSIAAIGNLIGRGPHALVAYEPHPLQFFVGIVGTTAKSRKGSSWSGPRYVVERLDPEWFRTRVRSGLSTAEGLIYNVRDPVYTRQPIKQKGRIVDYETVMSDEGEADKRLFIIESELAVVLRRMARESNALSGTLRDAWDKGTLSTLTRTNPLRASGTHISLVAHITQEELRRYLNVTETANGFANRFLWLLVRRSRLCPEGEIVPAADLDPRVEELRQAVNRARTLGTLTRDPDAAALWNCTLYPKLTAAEPGLVGAVISRADPYVLRLGAFYAALDGSALIRPAHLLAAVALWEFAAASARLIFGGLVGDPVADLILDALRRRGPLSKTELFDLFDRHREATEIGAGLARLQDAGLIRRSVVKTGGRDREVWACV